MSRQRLIAIACVAWLWPQHARADDELAGVDPVPEESQALGAQLGLDLGGGVTPGGLHVGGRYLYRMSDVDWFDGGVGFTFGGGQASCFRDRDDSLVCDEGTLDGFRADVAAGIRRYFAGKNQFQPYAHAGLAARVISYGDDDLIGFAVPAWIGAGVRAVVYDGIAVGGGAVVSVGPAWMGRGLGLELQFDLLVAAGVEFRID